MSDAVFVSYETSEIRRALDKPDLDPPERLRLLRAEYTHLVNELRQISIADYHVENARGELMRKLTWTYLATLVIPALSVIAFSVANWCIPKHQSIFYPLLLLSYCGAAGATGAYISTLLRIEALPESWANAHNLAVLRYSHSLYAVPLTGLVFGIVLSLIISGDLLAGALFPKQGEWYTAVNTARFLAWGFIAGFAERLIPDVIDRLAQNARRLDTQTQK